MRILHYLSSWPTRFRRGLMLTAVHLSLTLFLMLGALSAWAQATGGSGSTASVNGTPPRADANCTVTAMNRTAPLQADYSFTIYNIPGAGVVLGPAALLTPPPPAPFRVRALCSDGTVGETNLAFPEFGSTVVYTGEIYWRPATPIPLALALAAAQSKLTTGQSTQLSTTGILANAQTIDLSARDKGTLYTSSNPLIATVDNNGAVAVTAGFASSSSARVLMTAQNEGVAGSTLLQLGPRGRLTGRVLRADGSTPVAGAQVTVIRNQPREALGTVLTDASGNFVMEDVSAGSFSVSVIESATGDLGRGFGSIANEGEVGNVDVRLNGQGTLTVNVVNGAGSPVTGAQVSFTSLSGYRDLRTVATNASGQVVLERAMAGPFTVSTRDNATNLVGAAVGTLSVGAAMSVTLKLQPVGNIAGTVYASDGSTAQAGVQVRIVSAVRGVMTQVVTLEDGKFRFESLPLSDGPYTLDAMQNGRLRARVPSLILTSASQELTQNIVFGPAGLVSGLVSRASGVVAAGVTVTVQSQVGQRFAFSTKTDAQGRYTIDGVPVGAFGISASAGGGETASGGGNIASDGDVVALNMQLAANGIVGTVFDRDGVRAVGASVTVSLEPGAQTTQTNAQGQFGFSVSQPNTYRINVADANGNRGFTSVVLTAINPGDPKTVNVTYLGRGAVQGVVRDPSGNAQANVQVNFSSSSVFGGATAATTDAQGRYRIEGQFVGEFTVYALNETTRLAGFGRGRIAADGDVISADVTLAATGSVSGQVFKQDNTTPVANAVVDLRVSGANALKATTDATGNYSFPAVPLGDFSVLATNSTDGDKGQVVSRLTTLNEARKLNVRLLGQGAVTINTVNSSGQAVAGVNLVLTSQSVFGGSFNATTGAEGNAVFASVFNGDFVVTGQKGVGITRLSGSTNGTMVNSATVSAIITLTNKPIGTLTGVVTKGLAALPQDGVLVRLRDNTTGAERSATADANGVYTFAQVEVGVAQRITAIVNDRVRARSDVTLSAPDETATRNLVLLGVGTVSGRAANAADAAQPGVLVTLSNPDPTYGGTWQVTTQADGTYNFADVPAGQFTIRARSNDNRLQAQDSGNVRFDADAVTINLTLVDSAVNMPINIYDANAMLFDMQGDGSIGTGNSSVFRGNSLADVRASRLEIVVNGVAVPFQNGDGTIGRLTQAGQLLEVDELSSASGLNVTRRVYVPKSGYFARHLEVLENRTANPITVGVKVSSHFAPGVVGARVVDTSSNDSVLDVSAEASRDRWVIVDDDRDGDPFEINSQPAVALVFDGVNSEAKVGEAGVTALGPVAKTSWQWRDVVVQPGTSVALMHFTAQQLGRIPARAAAERLSQLPPEALEGLTAEERAIIKNFKLPADGLSSLQPLPSVDKTSITGTIFAGDGSTAIPNASVIVKSESTLYGRTFRATANAAGQFTFNSPVAMGQGAPAIAQDRFSASAIHPNTKATTAIAEGQFVSGQVSAQQDLIFTGTGILKGNVKRHTNAVVSSGTASIGYVFPDGSYGCGSPGAPRLCTSIGGDGVFAFIGVAPRDYLVVASQSHPQGMPLNGSANGPVAVLPANTTLVDVVMEETGEVIGTVRAANGEPVVNASIQLDPSPYGPYRSTSSDTGGAYRFTDVALGGHAVLAVGSNDLTASANTTVVKDTQAVVNLQLAGLARVNVQVNYQRGAAAVGAYVYLVGRLSATTNGGGQTSFDVPAGVPVTVEARHPDNGDLIARSTLTVTGNGSTENVTLTLPPAAAILGTVFRPDGSTRASGISVVVRRADGTVYQRSTSTDANGNYRFNGMPLENYTVSAEDRATFKFADIDTATTSDGQEVTANLALADNRIALPSNLQDANGFTYDVQQTGSIGHGWLNNYYYYNSGLFSTGGVQLEINGQAFTGDTSASLEAGRRQLSVAQTTPIAGLNVTRKVFVPKGGYFARYLEVLENPSTTPVAVSVKLKSAMAYSGTTIVASSSGSSQVQATGVGRDTWVVLDDARDADPFTNYNSPPATSFVNGTAGTAPMDQLVLNTASGKVLEAGWSALTVPANGRVVLMHFVAQQINRAGAKVAAQRLEQLPPEAIQALSAEEIGAIVNFTMPTDGQSALTPLPSLTGGVTGTVFEGNQTTTVANVYLSLRSKHPLFNRMYSAACSFMPSGVGLLRSNATGVYSLNGRVQDADSLPLPVDSVVEIGRLNDDCYSYSGKHPLTGVSAPLVTASFAVGSSTLAQNIVFPTGILTGTVVGPVDYGAAGGYVYTNNVPDGYAAVVIANDGTYVLPGMPASVLTLTAVVPHNQGSQLTGARTVTAVLGQVTVTDIDIQPTGSVEGAVLTANGEASVGSSVRITGANSFYRYTATDSLGRFNLSAVPVGQYTLSVTDARTLAVTTVTVTVTQNQVTTQNINLLATGMVRVNVNYARGIPAADIDVYLTAQAIPSSLNGKGRTNAQGQLDVLVPQGSYTISVKHPTDPYYINLWKQVSGTITTNNETQSVTLNLSPRASVRVTALNLDANNAPIANAQITLFDSYCTTGCYDGTTNGSGQLLLTGIRDGNYRILARTSEGLTAEISGAVDTPVDGQTLDKTLNFTAQKDKLNVLSFVQERQLYSVAADANDVLNVTIVGAQVNGTGSAYITRAQIYDTSNTEIAGGYGYDARSSYGQYNQLADLRSVTAVSSGNYSIAISPYYTSNPEYLGGFRLEVKRNGVPVDVLGYQDGGSVSGNVTHANGNAIAGVTVELISSNSPALRVRTQTNANGGYTFEGVPLGAFSLNAVDYTAGSTPVASATGSVDSKGQTVVKDLRLPAKTGLQVQVTINGGLSVPTNLYYYVTDANGTRAAGPLVFAVGQTTSDPIAVSFVGDQATVKVSHPANSAIQSSLVITAADGQTVTATLTLEATSVSGRVLDALGVAVPNLTVYAYRAAGSYITAVTTDSQGGYQFAALPAGEELMIRVTEPNSSVHTTSRLTLSAGQSVTRDLQLVGTGLVKGVLSRSTGGVVANANVYATYAYDEANSTTFKYGYTNQAGEYSISGLPVGRPIVVSASLDTGFSTVQATDTITISTPGQEALLNLSIVIPGGSVLVRPMGADNLPINDLCYVISVQAINEQTRNRYYEDCGPGLVFDGVPAGQATISGTVGYNYTFTPFTVNVNEGQQTLAQINVPIIKGVVRFSDGSPVENPSVNVIGSNGQTIYATSSTTAGEYRVHGTPLGDFSLSAQHANSGLTINRTGTVADLTVPLVLDVVLPPAGVVTGIFRDKANQPITNADVYVRSSGLDIDRYATTDANGVYRLEQIATGTITVLARDPSTRLVTVVSGALTAQGAVLQLDMTSAPVAVVTGQVTNAGIGVSGASVSLSSVRSFGPFGLINQSTTADANGYYSFADVLVGDIQINAESSGISGSSIITTTLADTTMTLNVPLGNVVRLGYDLNGSDTSRYDVQCDGALSDGGFSGRGDAYDGAYKLSVNGANFPCLSIAAVPTLNGLRELVLGPKILGALEVTRRIFVPAEGGYARYLEVLNNSSANEITVPVRVNSNLGSDGNTRLIVAPSQSNGLYAITTDGGSDPALGHVFASGGATVTGIQAFNAPNDNVDYNWTITVPAGGTISLMHFAIQRNTLDTTAVQAQAEALSNMTQSGMFNGLSAGDKSSIKNFLVAP
jgi:hypothetical protein